MADIEFAKLEDIEIIKEIEEIEELMKGAMQHTGDPVGFAALTYRLRKLKAEKESRGLK